MENIDILKLVNCQPDSYVQIIKARYRNFYDKINTDFLGANFGEKLYKYINGENSGECKCCGKLTKFKSFIIGYASYCSRKCSNKSTSRVRAQSLIIKNTKNRDIYYETKPCAICNTKFDALKFRNQKCCSAKCSGIYVASKPNRVEKIKKSKLEKYGNSTYVNPGKARKTCLNKYGVDNVFKFRDIKLSIKNSNFKKYGTEFPSQTSNVKDKIKETNLIKYGVENPSKASFVKDKIKKTFLEHYGVDNVFKHRETMQLMYSENFKKYGAKIPVNGEQLKRTMLSKFKNVVYTSVIERLIQKCDCIPLFTLQEYISTDKINTYRFKCKTCNDVFYDHIDGGHLPRCLKCNPYIAGFSLHEKEIAQYLSDLIGHDKIIENDRTILNGLELDIYIPTRNIAIEYNGLYWHSNVFKEEDYHLNKTQLCKKKGIQLIHIFENEWIYKKEIVKSKLAHLLIKKTETPIYARKCEIHELSNVANFLDNNHIQGDCPSAIKLGAFYNNTLVAVMTFCKRRIALGKKQRIDGEYELLRFATCSRVVGIAGKLLEYFKKMYNPIKIITYADMRYSIGNLYEKIGFTYIHESKPNYWYFVDGGNILWHRFNFRKDQLYKKLVNFDNNLSEWENMKNNGYDRIWDCGNILYEWNNEIKI